MKRRSDGDGSIYQEHEPGCPERNAAKPKCSCKWRGALVIGTRDGKMLRKRVTSKTKAGAAARLRDLHEKYADEAPPLSKPVTVEWWLRYWLRHVVTPTRRPNTVAAYTAAVNLYLIPLLGHHRLDRLNADHIDAAWTYLREHGNPKREDRQPLSPNHIHQIHTILARALKVAVQRKRLRTNPASADAMDAPPLVDVAVQPFSNEAVEKIEAAAAGTYGAVRWMVGLSLGLRPGEVLGLLWDDIDLDARTLRVERQIQRIKGKGLVYGPVKSKRGERTVPLPSYLVTELRAHRADQLQRRLEVGSHWTDTGAVFTYLDGRPVCPDEDSKRWARLLVKAGVPHQRRYDARHTAATLLLARGVPQRIVMDILGHSQIQVTAKYQHATDPLLQAAADALDAGRREA